jgi:hypothetical protein
MQRWLVQLEKTPLEQLYWVSSLVFDEQMIGYVGFHAQLCG